MLGNFKSCTFILPTTNVLNFQLHAKHTLNVPDPYIKSINTSNRQILYLSVGNFTQHNFNVIT